MITIPSCYFLQSHLSDVLTDWEGQGEGVLDEDTWPGQYVYWEPTDPAYGCYNDLATVTATDYGATSTSGIGGPTSSQGGSSITTTSTSVIGEPTSSNGGSSTTMTAWNPHPATVVVVLQVLRQLPVEALMYRILMPLGGWGLV